jgi:uncharacterized protein (TIGR02145 family)
MYKILKKLTLAMILAVSVLLSSSTPTQAQTTPTDLSLSVNPVIVLSIANCDSSNASSVDITIDPSSTGVFKSACQNLYIAANTPGYSLSIKSSSTDLIYQNPTTISPTPVIPSTTNTIANPAVFTNDTWGFAIEKATGLTNNFDTSYTVNNASNKYALLPITNYTIYQTDKVLTESPAPLTDFRAFYGAELTLATIAGQYKTTITYTAIGAEVPEPVYYAKVMNGVSFQDKTTNQSESCDALPIYDGDNPTSEQSLASTVTMTDTRNGQQYDVRRLQDGKCWMIDNLKLATYNASSSDTDLNTIFNFVIPEAYDGSDPDYISDDVPHVFCPIPGDTGAGATNYGYLYNWSVATAGETSTSINSTGLIAPNSICPANWRLPTGGTIIYDNEAGYIIDGEGDFYDLYEVLERDPDEFSPTGSFRGVFSGYWRAAQSDTGYRAHYSFLWSSAVYYRLAFGLDLRQGLAVPGTSWRGYGQSIRCTSK